MPRVLPALKLDPCPLVFTLAQVRFSPVLLMGDFVPRIQEELRGLGYPKFSSETIGEILLGPQASVGATPRWLFTTKTGDGAVVLSPNFLVLETTNYDVFDTFLENLRQAISVVHDIARAELVERLGLRYVNLVRPEAEELVEQYLQPHLLGLGADDLGVEEVLQRHETRARTRVGHLIVRVQQGNRVLPPDLDSAGLNVETLPSDEIATLLDIDHFSVGEWDFSAEEIVDGMWDLHEFTDRAFRTAVTDYALMRWGAKELPSD